MYILKVITISFLHAVSAAFNLLNVASARLALYFFKLGMTIRKGGFDERDKS